MKIEHQRRERERIAARQRMEQQRSRRHAKNLLPFRSTRVASRCPCGFPWPGRTRFPGIKIGQWNIRFPRIGCLCGSGYYHRQRKEELLKKLNETRQASPFGKCPTLFQITDQIQIPKRIPVQRCFCPDTQSTSSNSTKTNSTTSYSSCYCLTPAQHRRLEEDLGSRVKRLHWYQLWKKCADKELERTRRHLLEEAEEVNKKMLTKSGDPNQESCQDRDAAKVDLTSTLDEEVVGVLIGEI